MQMTVMRRNDDARRCYCW